MSAHSIEHDAKRLCELSLSELELYMPGVVRALGDIYRDHLAHESIRFVVVAIPASCSMRRAVIGTNFPIGQSAAVRELLRAAGEQMASPLIVEPTK